MVTDLGPDSRLGAHLVIVAGAALVAANRLGQSGRFAAPAYPALRLKVTPCRRSPIACLSRIAASITASLTTPFPTKGVDVW